LAGLSPSFRVREARSIRRKNPRKGSSEFIAFRGAHGRNTHSDLAYGDLGRNFANFAATAIALSRTCYANRIEKFTRIPNSRSITRAHSLFLSLFFCSTFVEAPRIGARRAGKAFESFSFTAIRLPRERSARIVHKRSDLAQSEINDRGSIKNSPHSPLKIPGILLLFFLQRPIRVRPRVTDSAVIPLARVHSETPMKQDESELMPARVIAYQKPKRETRAGRATITTEAEIPLLALLAACSCSHAVPPSPPCPLLSLFATTIVIN